MLTAASDNKIYSTNFRSSINELIEIISSSDVNSIIYTNILENVFKFRNCKEKRFEIINTWWGNCRRRFIIKNEKIVSRCKNYPNLRNNRAWKIFSVHDSKAVSYEYLEKYGLKISNNQLFVKKGSTHISTNDFVDVVGNRVIFTGRNSDFIKVAGSKVNLNMVEKK